MRRLLNFLQSIPLSMVFGLLVFAIVGILDLYPKDFAVTLMYWLSGFLTAFIGATAVRAKSEKLKDDLKRSANATVGSIEELKKLSEHLKGMETQLEMFFERTPIPLCIVGTDGYFKKLNKAWEKMLNIPNEEMMGKPWADFVHPDDVEASLKSVEDRVEGVPRATTFINRYRGSDGMYRHIQWETSVLHEGNIYCVAINRTEAYEKGWGLQPIATASLMRNREE